MPSTRTPGISLVKSADLGEVVVGSEVTYSFTIRNTGNVTLGEIGVTETAFTGSGELSAVECPTTVLAPGDEVTCTATYVATQADIDRGGVDNTATSHGLPPWPADPVQSNPSDATIPAPSSPGLSLVKTADTDRATSVGSSPALMSKAMPRTGGKAANPGTGVASEKYINAAAIVTRHATDSASRTARGRAIGGSTAISPPTASSQKRVGLE